jgi:hypothetical protein
MQTKRSVGIVTTAATGGATVGNALAQIIVWWAEQNQLDMSRIEVAISVVLTAGFGVLGGYLVPSNHAKGRYEA